MIKKYISPFLNNYIQNQPTQNLQSSSNKMALKQTKPKKDKIELSKEENVFKKPKNKKFIIIGGITAIAGLVGGIYLVKSGKGKQFFEYIREKINNSEIINSIKNKFKNKAVTSTSDTTFDLLNSKFARNKEQIIVPNGSYDLSKETGTIEFMTNTLSMGFDMKHCKLFGNISGNRTYYGFGLTADGKSFVKIGYGANNCQIGVAKNYDENLLSSISIVGRDSNFTPAQKNIIALIRQGKQNSLNSPIGKTYNFDELDSKKLYDMIAKWSQDLDINHEETKIVLGNFKKYYNQDQHFEFFKKLHLN